jgi:hypothetical protein
MDFVALVSSCQEGNTSMHVSMWGKKERNYNGMQVKEKTEEKRDCDCYIILKHT